MPALQQALNGGVIGYGFRPSQDEESLAMVLTLCPGGDLSFLLKSRYNNPNAKDRKARGRFRPLPEGAVRFYAASIALGLQAIHAAGFVYRE